MSAKCKYGDAESHQKVPCRYDQQSGTLECPQPYRRAGAAEKLRGVEVPMEVKFVNERGEETGTRTTTLLAEYSEEDEQPLLLGPGTQSERKTPKPPTNDRKEKKSEHFRRKILKSLSITLADVTGEFIGTFFLTLVICTAVASSVITGAQLGLWQVAVVCGLGVGLSIYCTAYVSRAHLNPAMTLAFAIVRPKVFSWRKIVPYITAQLLGGFCAGGVLYGLYRHAIAQFEADHDLVRGENRSENSAMVFGEYFPNPALYNHSVEENLRIVSAVEAAAIEAWATGILAFVVFSLTDHQNSAVGGGKHKVSVPILIGTTVAVLISLYAPLTQAGLNPARDFGPRLFAACAGWGRIAVPGPRKGFWAYIVGPAIGGPIGAAVYDCLVAKVVQLVREVRKKEQKPS